MLKGALLGIFLFGFEPLTTLTPDCLLCDCDGNHNAYASIPTLWI